MEYTQLSLTLEEYQESKEGIKKELSGIARGFVRTGWYLNRIDVSGAYKMDGYKSIAEFAQAEYNMTPSGVTRFIEVYNRYSVPGDTPELQERYQGYNFSQLQEMLQLPLEDHDMILPEAKRETIRELKRFNKENENNPERLMNWQTEQTEDKVEQAIIDFFRCNKELTNHLFGSTAWEQADEKELVEIINPSGNRSHRKGTVYLMMYGLEQGIMVNEFQKGKHTIFWPEFFDTVSRIFGEAIDGAKTWQNYFGGTEDEERRDSENDESGSTGKPAGSDGHAGVPAKTGSVPDGAGESERTEQRTNDRAAAPAGTAAGQEPKRDKHEEPERPAEAEKTGDEPQTEEAAEEKTPESVIAPAQEKTESQKEIQDCAVSDNNPVEQEPERLEGEVLLTPEQSVPFGSRWEFLKTQAPYAIALYIAATISETEYGQLRDADFWDKWLRQEVDEEGETFEQTDRKK